MHDTYQDRSTQHNRQNHLSKSRGYHQNNCFILFPVRKCMCILGVTGGFNLAVHYHSHGSPSSPLSEEKQQFHKYIQLTLQTSCKLSRGMGSLEQTFHRKLQYTTYYQFKTNVTANSMLKQHGNVLFSRPQKKNFMKEEHTSSLCKNVPNFLFHCMLTAIARHSHLQVLAAIQIPSEGTV